MLNTHLNNLHITQEKIKEIAEEKKELLLETDENTVELRAFPMIFKKKQSVVILIINQTQFKKLEIEKMKKELQNLLIKSISHELRTPLNAINGSLDLIWENSSDKEIKDLAKKGKQSGKLLLHLIINAHSLAKIESNSFILKKDKCHIPTLVMDAVELNKLQALSHNLIMNIDIQKDVPQFITADKSCLQQILLILISNSAKYTFKGSINLSVSFSNNKNQLLFQIADTGAGIPSHKLNNIFQLFSNATSKDHKHGIHK
jgi:signal transduction histidine kinase